MAAEIEPQAFFLYSLQPAGHRAATICGERLASFFENFAQIRLLVAARVAKRKSFRAGTAVLPYARSWRVQASIALVSLDADIKRTKPRP